MKGYNKRGKLINKLGYIFFSVVLLTVTSLSSIGIANVDTVDIITNGGFELGHTYGWYAFGSKEILATTDEAYSGNYSALVNGRTDTWQGIAQSVLGTMKPGKTYEISAWVRLQNSNNDTVELSLKKSYDEVDSYHTVAQVKASSTQWTQIKSTFTFDDSRNLSDLVLYFQGPAVNVNFYVDDFKVIEENSNTHPVTYGDLNGDGKIDSTDYILIKRYILNIINEFPIGTLEVADLNGDEKINSIDAILMRRHILGIIDEFPVLTKPISAFIDANIKHQTIEGFGASIAFYQNWLVEHPSKAEIYDVIFNELGLSVLRLNNWYITYEDKTPFDPTAKEIVEEAKKSVGNDLKIMMSSWSPPTYLKSNNANAGGTLKKENGEFVYDKFANFWYDSLKAYEKIGVVPDYISIQNEPDMDAGYESCNFDKDENGTNAIYGKALAAVYNKLNSNMNNKPKILGPEVLGIGYNNLSGYMRTLNIDHLDGIAFHLYHGGNENSPDSFNTELGNINKTYPNIPKYQTEFYRGDAFNTAWIMHNNLTVGNVCMYLYWDLIWENGGLVSLENPWDKSKWTTPKGYIVSDKYYTFKQYAKFIRPGYTRIDASVKEDDVKISAYISPDKKSISVVLLNTSSLQKTVSLDFKDFIGTNSEIYRTSDKEKGAFIGSLGEGNTVVLPAKSIATVVIK